MFAICGLVYLTLKHDKIIESGLWTQLNPSAILGHIALTHAWWHGTLDVLCAANNKHCDTYNDPHKVMYIRNKLCDNVTAWKPFYLPDPLRRSPVFSPHTISVIHNINLCSHHPELLNKHGCSIYMNNRIALITIPFMPHFTCQNFTHDLLSFLCKIWRQKRFIKYYW